MSLDDQLMAFADRAEAIGHPEEQVAAESATQVVQTLTVPDMR